jgi:hypothetical protein
MTFKVGDCVVHSAAEHLGAGIITDVFADGAVRVNFSSDGEKKIASNFVQFLRTAKDFESINNNKKLLTGLKTFNKSESYYRQYLDGYWEDSFHQSLREQNKVVTCNVKHGLSYGVRSHD